MLFADIDFKLKICYYDSLYFTFLDGVAILPYAVQSGKLLG